MSETTGPRVVRRVRGEKLPPNTKPIDRSTGFGNPFKIGRDGTREEVIEKYRAWLTGEGPDVIGKWDRRKVLLRLPKLRGLDLACYCVPEPCHGDVLLEIANRPRPDLGQLSEEMFADDGVFGSRGISRAVAKGAFFPYAQGDGDAVLLADPTIVARGEGAINQALERAARAPGIMMRRWPVPGAEPFITGEMRPDWPIYTGGRIRIHRHTEMTKHERAEHLKRGQEATGEIVGKVTGEDVRRGTTLAEYEAFAERYPFAATHVVGKWNKLAVYGDADGLAMGADHLNKPTNRRHVHIPVTKYLFAANPMKTITDPGSPHKHRDFYEAARPRDWDGLPNEWANRQLALHTMYKHAKTRTFYAGTKVKDKDLDDVERWFHRGGDVIQTTGRERIPLDKIHEHEIDVKDTEIALARRLSIHPASLERLEEAERVFLALEGCLKETALVSTGEVTFSCPSVTLWGAPELESFALKHLQGRRVYVCCDSDWSRPDDDSVVRQVLLTRDRLRNEYGVDAHAAAPPTPVRGKPDGLWQIHCSNPKHKKHGIDDHLGPCTGSEGSIDNVIVIDREAKYGLAEWIADNAVRTETGRKPRVEGVERDAIVLRWLALHAGADGETRVSLTTVAKNIQGELDAPTENAARVAVERSIKNLIQYGAVEEVEPIKERSRWHYRKEYKEWTGVLKVVDGLKADTVLTRIRDVG